MSSNVKDQKSNILRELKTVITRAIFWKISHNNTPDQVHLKIGRYNKIQKRGFFHEELEFDSPKSELTLDSEEFENLVKFLQENYEPFKKGVKAFIPIDNPYDVSVAQELKKLFSNKGKEMVEFLLKNEIIPDELETALLYAKRVRAIDEFNAMLESNLTENKWQKWFETNSWVLSSNFVKILDDRTIDTHNISDFLVKSYDGFLDIVEIKRPEGNLKFWQNSLDHGNYIPHSDLIKAITQSLTYIYEIEREANSVKFLEQVEYTKVIKPRCTLIFGRSADWNKEEKEAFRILNSSYHNLTIMTFDHVLDRAKRILGKGHKL